MKVKSATIQTLKPVNQSVSDFFERIGEDEPNCSKVMVGPDMKPEDVVRMVLEKVNLNGEDWYI